MNKEEKELLIPIIKNFFDDGYTQNQICESLNITRGLLRYICEKIGLCFSSRPKKIIENKKCKICGEVKSLECFRKRERYNKILYECYCLDCEKEYKKSNCKLYYSKNKNRWIEYKLENKDKIKEYQKNYEKEYRKDRRKNDLNYKIRSSLSTAIFVALRKNSSGKRKKSCLSFLSYSIKELREHLESLFEPWMNWDNWGKYDAKIWDDNDPSTWKWQIDHIIPKSMFKYTSMEDEEFKKCWALENLRPYSAKQNFLDGCTKTRHKRI